MFNRFVYGPLREAASGEADGGGDPTVVAAEGADPEAVAAAQPPPLTLESILGGLKGALPDMIKPLIADQMNGTVARLEKEVKKIKTAQAAPPVDPASATDPFASQRERELNERIQRIEKEREEEREKSLVKEMEAEIKTALAEFPWNGPEGKEIAFDYYKAKVSRNDDNELVIGALPLNRFIKEHAPRAFAGYHQNRNVGGSGNATNRNASVKGFSIEQIRPGMSVDEDKQAREAIASAFTALRKSTRG